MGVHETLSGETVPGHAPGFFVPGDGETGAGHRLVKGTKSPTDRVTPRETPGAWGIVEYREWAQEWRVRTQVYTTSGSAPPENYGERVTDALTERAAKIIAESCQYVATCKGGYRTFLTLTFDADWRARIERQETTIQREVSRFLDGLTKIWRRGWSAKTPDGERVGERGRTEPLLYCWVAECPKNDEGEDNPHVHVLLTWRVPYKLFPAWCARIEALWGRGFAHLEKIRAVNAAGGYMLKALGYMTKGKDADAGQGRIRGNRYNLSAAARAPAWVVIERAQLHALGALIADVHEHVTDQYGHLYRQRRQLRETLDQVPKEHKAKRQRIGRRLEKVRRILAEEVPVVASKYQIIARGADAFRELRAWLGARGAWRAPVRWLPPKGEAEYWASHTKALTQWGDTVLTRVRIWNRRMARNAMPPPDNDEWRGLLDFYDRWEPVTG